MEECRPGEVGGRDGLGGQGVVTRVRCSKPADSTMCAASGSVQMLNSADGVTFP
ncbi:hypothetical protein ACFQ1S_05145 [Kibdelosporangium lantanae]|uniref:Uncharacterized protein n=1 Tax=Kibdelosporangium lantanae TaxID=1497396 RepID=A0ABW3M516_9PSEU